MINFIIKFITVITVIDIIFVILMIRYSIGKGEW